MKKVLIACEFSGVVREAFRALGNDAWSCDLLPTDIPGNHIQGDVLNVLDGGWDLMIAHPPCTWLCAAMRTNAARKDRPSVTAKYVSERDKAMNFVLLLYNCSIPRVAVENPIGYLNGAWRKPDQIIHPYEFGHDVRKDTCLWLKRLPPLMATIISPKNLHRKVDYWSNKRNPNGRSLKSITYSGIAKAMAEQWTPLL